jgi:putative hemolysin
VIVGEAVPRAVHRGRANLIAPWAATFVTFSRIPFAPLLPFVRAWASALQRLTGSGSRTALTRQEILGLLRKPADPHALDAEEQRMIARVFAITETTVDECMTPLVRVDAVPADATVRQAVTVAVRNGHTRLPVYRDRVDHIVGFLHARDLLFGIDDDQPIGALIRPVKYVPDSKRVDELLDELRREREPFAIVVDEYGGSVGILTIEDLLEELIGEIRDEREGDDAGIRRLSELEWRVAAKVRVSAVAAEIARPIPEGEYETIAGLVLAQLGRIPRTGESVIVGDIAIRVEDASERAIHTVIVSIPRAARSRTA